MGCAPRHHHYRGAGRIYFLLPLFWLALSIVGMAAYINVQTHKLESAFNDRAAMIGGRFTELNHGIGAVLGGFAAMLVRMSDADRPDHKMMTSYANEMRRVYPQIYMLEMIERVPREDLTSFESRQSRLLGRPFRVRTFDYSGTRAWLPLADQENYYVITLMEPSSSGDESVLGLDVLSSREQALALNAAIRSGRTEISLPYEAANGFNGYAMIRPVDATRSRFAKVIVRSDEFTKLLWLNRQNDLDIVIRHRAFPDGDPAGVLYSSHAEGGDGEGRFLPRFHSSQMLGTDGDLPFVIEVSQQLRWGDLDLPQMLVLLLFEGVVLVLLVRLAMEHHNRDLERQAQEIRLVYMANHDSLTGLPNRSLLMDRLEQAILRAKRDSGMFGLLFIDIDRFKAVNDTYGHDSGDRFLMITAEVLSETVRAQDTVSRLSGDEFVILLERIERREELAKIAAKIRDRFISQVCSGYSDLGVGISIGLAMYPDDGEDAFSLLRHADTHMYGQKKSNPAQPPMR